MFIEPASLDELRNVQNVLNSTLAGVVKDFYMISEETIPYQITIRSSAFRVYTKDRYDDYEYFHTPLTVSFTINSLRRGENSVSNISVHYCLNRTIFALVEWSKETSPGPVCLDT